MRAPTSTFLDVELTQRGITNVRVAECCGTTTQAVRNWRDGSRRPSTQSARIIAAEFGIELHRLRPDVWDAPTDNVVVLSDTPPAEPPAVPVPVPDEQPVIEPPSPASPPGEPEEQPAVAAKRRRGRPPGRRDGGSVACSAAA